MKIVTFNAGLLSIDVLWGLKKVEPAAFVADRLAAMPAVLAALDADLLLMQEVYSQAHKAFLARELASVLPHVAFSRVDSRFRLLPDSLMVFSKQRLEAAQFIRFEAGRWDERLLDTKGFMSVDLPASPLGPMRVLKVHTTAGVFTHPENPKIDRV